MARSKKEEGVFVHTDRIGMRWRVVGARAGAFHAILSQPEPPGGDLLKWNPVRTVSCHPLPGSSGPAVILKRYRFLKLWDRLRYLFIPSRAEAEWRALRLFRRLGIPGPLEIAVGERKKGPFTVEGALAMTRVEGSPLEAGVKGLDGEARREVIARVGATVRGLHDRGIDHPDLHGGNVFIAPDGRITIIDLHSCRFRRRLPARRRRRNLAKLLHSMSGWADPAERRHLLQAYMGRHDPARSPGRPIYIPGGSAPLPWGPDREFEVIEALAGRMERARLRSRSRRCLVDSSRFVVERHGRYRIYHLRSVPRAAILELLGPFSPGWTVLKERRKGGRVFRAEICDPGGGPGERRIPVCVKERPIRGPFRRLATLFQDHGLRRAWKAAHALWVRRIPTPEGIALVEERGRIGVRRAWFVTGCLDGVVPITAYLRERFLRAQGGSPAEKHGIARSLGRFVRSIHRTGIYHHDLAGQNILVRPGPAPAEGPGLAPGTHGPEGHRFWLVDLDSIFLWQRLSPSRARKNLVQLGNIPEGHVSWTDRFRFLRAYDPEMRDPDVLRAIRQGILREFLKIIRRLTRMEYRGEISWAGRKDG